jgi:hypothetical protein
MSEALIRQLRAELIVAANAGQASEHQFHSSTERVCIIANLRDPAIWRGVPVPWYLFTVLAPDGAAKDAGSTNLLDDDTARHYGHPMIRELKQREGEYDPKLKLVIRNGAGVMSHIIPF